jgi:hypothetical protein
MHNRVVGSGLSAVIGKAYSHSEHKYESAIL